MLIFAGAFEHRIDGQGRVSVPARFRAAFNEGMILSKSYDNCVLVYTVSEWETVAAELARRPANLVAARRLNRHTFSGAYPTSLDRNGRVLLPPQLRNYASLVDDVVIVGTGRFVEIWDNKEWFRENQTLDSEAASIAETAPVVVPGGQGS